MKNILIILLVALGIGAGIGYYQFNRKAENPADAKADMTLNAAALLREFSENEQAANEKYNGKLLEAQGKIASVNKKDDGTVEVILETDDPMSGVSCVAAAENAAAAEQYQVGDNVTVRGTCTGYLSDVILSPCAVVKKD